MSSHTAAGNGDAGLRCSVLGPRRIERIHETALEILQKTGIVLHYPASRDLLRKNGATVDEDRQLVRIPAALVQRAIDAAPRSVTLHGMSDPAKDCRLGIDGGHYARPGTGLNWVIDRGSRVRRPVTGEDLDDWTRVVHALPDLHFASSLYDQESTPQSMEERATARMLCRTDKPLMVSALSGEGMRWIKRLIEVVQPPDRPTRLMVLSSVNSPLIYGHGQTEAAMVSAELGIPVVFNSSAVQGASAPVTLAGQLALMHAEMLTALTIIQLHRPGAAVIYAGHPMVMDMKTGSPAIGSPEIGLTAAACIEIGRHFGLPTGSCGLTSDACTADPMSVADKWATGFLPAIVGANVNGAAGTIGTQSTVSFEQLVIDHETFGYIFRQMRGIEVDDESLAADVVDGVGPGGSYLMEDHTLAHHRREILDCKLANRLSATAWQAAGAKDAVERAADVVHDILSRPVTPIITDRQAQELGRVLKAAESALADLVVPV